jgi:hypothetical protein
MNPTCGLNLDSITELPSRLRAANIGVAMGSINNLFCLDVDGAEGLHILLKQSTIHIGIYLGIDHKQIT